MCWLSGVSGFGRLGLHITPSNVLPTSVFWSVLGAALSAVGMRARLAPCSSGMVQRHLSPLMGPLMLVDSIISAAQRGQVSRRQVGSRKRGNELETAIGGAEWGII